MNKHRKDAWDESRPVVPIVPMLDLTFQLLFFFITLFDPSTGRDRLVEGEMDLMLPSAAKKESANQAADPENIKPDAQSTMDDKNDELELDNLPSSREEVPVLTVVATSQGNKDGSITALFVESHVEQRDRQLDEAVKTQIENDDKELTKLVEYLTKEREKSPKASCRVKGDSKLRWEEMLRVMDVCRKAGFKSVGFVQPDDFGQ
jgi:biopolymer transport protein ExbD